MHAFPFTNLPKPSDLRRGPLLLRYLHSQLRRPQPHLRRHHALPLGDQGALAAGAVAVPAVPLVTLQRRHYAVVAAAGTLGRALVPLLGAQEERREAAEDGLTQQGAAAGQRHRHLRRVHVEVDSADGGVDTRERRELQCRNSDAVAAMVPAFSGSPRQQQETCAPPPTAPGY